MKRPLLSLLLCAAAAATDIAGAATPNVRVTLSALDVEALLDATVTLVPMQTAAPTSGLFLTLPTRANEGGVCTFTNVPAGRYRLHAANSGVADLLIIVPDTADEVLAEACIDPASNWTAPAPVRRPYINPRGASVLWPGTNGLAGQAILDDGTGRLYFGAAGSSLPDTVVVDPATGGLTIGTNTVTAYGAAENGETLISYRNSGAGEDDEYNAILLGLTNGEDAYSEALLENYETGADIALATGDGTQLARASITVDYDSDDLGAAADLVFRLNGRLMTRLNPAAWSSSGDVTPYTFDTKTNIASSSPLARYRTNGADVFTIAHDGRLWSNRGLATNAANATVTTNQFVLDQLYTNFAQRALIMTSITMTNVNATDKCQVSIWVDQDADGSWERTGITCRLQGVAALAGTSQLTAFLQPGARFIITNQSVTGGASIVGNSSSWIQQ